MLTQNTNSRNIQQFLDCRLNILFFIRKNVTEKYENVQFQYMIVLDMLSIYKNVFTYVNNYNLSFFDSKILLDYNFFEKQIKKFLSSFEIKLIENGKFIIIASN